MPRASLESNKVLQPGFGIQEGKVGVLDARFKIVQRQKKDGTLITPMFILQLDCTKLDDKWDVIDETMVEQTDLLLGWGSKETGEDGNHKFRFRPGNAKGPDDNDPEDLGPVINTEGNSFYCEQEGDMPYADADAMIFMKSLEAKGWKTEINAQGFAPNYKGAKFEVKSVLKTDLCKKYGIKYNPQEGQEKATIWEVVQLHTRPYEKKAGQAAGKSTTQSKTTAGAAGAGKTNGAAGAAGFMDENLDRTVVALALLKEPSQQFADAVKGEKGVKRDAFQKAFTMELMRRKVHPKIQTDLKKMMVEDDVLTEWGSEVGFMVDVEAKTVTFVS